MNPLKMTWQVLRSFGPAAMLGFMLLHRGASL